MESREQDWGWALRGQSEAREGAAGPQDTHLCSPRDGDGAGQQVPDDVLQGHAQPVHVDGVDQPQAVLERGAEQG